MAPTESVPHTFHEGDEVVLVEGTCRGASRAFSPTQRQRRMGDTGERHGTVRSHPVAWPGHVVKRPEGPGRQLADVK